MFCWGRSEKKTHVRCLEARDCSSCPLKLLSQVPGAIGTGLWNSPWPLCSRGKLGSLSADQRCTAHWRAAAGHKQAAVPWATKHEPGRGWQPLLWGFRSPEDKEQAALAVPMRQTGSTKRAQQTTEACVLLCVLQNPYLFPAVSLHLQAHTLQVYMSQSLPYHPSAPCSFQISRCRLPCT